MSRDTGGAGNENETETRAPGRPVTDGGQPTENDDDRSVRVGVIGCGTIAQVMHVPYLLEIPDATLVGLADPATDRVRTLAERYGVTGYETATALIEAERPTAVVIATPPQAHAEAVEAALDAGVATFVEKPLTVAPEEAATLADRAAAATVPTMVGYMKRYDPAYERAQDRIADLSVDLVSAYDVDPDHERILEEVYDLVGGAPPAAVVEASTDKRRNDAAAAIGVDDPDDDRVGDYDWHLEHICHDVNLLRGLFGDVIAIDHVDRYAGGRYLTAHLRYEGDVRCTLDSGLSERKWFEETIRVDGPGGMVALSFANPFLRNSPTELRVRTGREAVNDERRLDSYEEPFKRELEHFLACVRADRRPRTDFAEAAADVALIADLFRAEAGAAVR